MRWPIVCLAFLAMCCTACHSTPKELTPQQQVSFRLESYFQALISGQYAQCVQAVAGYSSMLPEQRVQMADVYRQYSLAQHREHGGLVDARAVEVVLQDGRAEVFVELVFADSLTERVVVPMVLEDQEWRVE